MISYTGFSSDEMDRLEKEIRGKLSFLYWFHDGRAWYWFNTGEVVDIEEEKRGVSSRHGYWVQSERRAYFVAIERDTDIKGFERCLYNITGEQHD